MQNTSKPTAGEIDLFELFSSLWKNKLCVIAITCVGIALAAIYAFTAKEEWTSKAQIIQPNTIQFSNYLEVQQWYSRLTNDDGVSIDASPEAMQRGYLRVSDGNGVNVDESLKYAYNTLIVMLGATDSRLGYLKNSAYFKKQSMEINDDLAKQKMLVDMATDDLQIKATEKNKVDSFDISFSAETANDAQKTLIGYIEKTNTIVLSKLFEDLRLQINESIRTLENDINNIKQQTEQAKKNQIMLLKQAIVAAKDANIVEYTGESTVAGNTIIDFSNSGNMFLLGEKYLTAQLKSIETSPLIYPVAYYQTLSNISGLKQLLELPPKGMAFEYTQAPSLPLVKDKPKKVFILILGALLGGMLGCGIVLVRSAVSNRKAAK